MVVIKTSHYKDRLPWQRLVVCELPPALILSGQTAACAVSRGCTITGLRGWVPLEGLDDPGNAEEPQKALEESLAPPEMEGQRVCLSGEKLYLCTCVCVQADLYSWAQHSHKSAGREAQSTAPNSVLPSPPLHKPGICGGEGPHRSA